VNGTLMRGLELNGNLLAAGASFVREDRTAPVYRLWSIGDKHPAMVRVAKGSARSPRTAAGVRISRRAPRPHAETHDDTLKPTASR
jgi:hypothetical protein